jgi:hypothetical protein
VSSLARDRFLTLVVTSRLFSQPVTYIGADFRRYLDKYPGILTGG